MMKIKHIIFFIIYLHLTFLKVNAQTSSNHYVIASGSRGGNYYKAGNFITSVYNKTFNNSSFSVIETNGSNENIELLKNNSVDFAIVQRNILINNIYKKGDGIKNLAVISPLFQEKLLIYFHGDKEINLSSIDSLLKFKKLKIGYTSKKGFSYKIFHTLTRFLNLNLTNTVEIEGNYNYLTSLFKEKKLDILVSFSLPLTTLENTETIKKMYISNGNALMIESRFHNISATKLNKTKNQYSLGSWSFLIGTKSSIKSITPENKLFTSLYEYSKKTIDNPIALTINNSLSPFIKNSAHEIHQLKNLSLSSGLNKITHIKSINYTYLIFSFLSVFLLIYYFYIKRKYLNLFGFLQRYKHFQLGLFLLFVVYFSSIELIIYAEKSFYNEIGIKSQILNMTKSDLHSWLLITTVTGNSNGIFPLSLLGKGMLALNSLNFWIGTILIGFSEYATYKINKKRKQGLMETKFSNHLVIFGWNSTTESFIIETLSDAKEYNNTKIDIVCVVSNIIEVRNNNPKIKALHDSKKIDIIQGDALETQVLHLSHVERANAVILLSEDGSKLSDERTAMRAHAISRFTKKQKNKGVIFKTSIISKVKQRFKTKLNHKIEQSNYKKYKIEKTADTVYMIAELNNDNLRETLIDADVNEIIVAGNYKKSIIKQSLFNHGISKVLDEIMQYNEYNEFYKIDLSKQENSHLRNKNYDELLIALRKQGILLIGVHIVFHDEDDNIIIDQSIIQQLLQQEDTGISRDIIINPTDEIETNRLVDEDDHLIVLATNISQLKKGVKKIVFNS